MPFKKKAIADISGEKFGRLTILEFSHKDVGHQMWKARCDCGNIIIVRKSSLITGNTKSCGCFNRESAAKRLREIRTIHGLSQTSTWNSWKSMFERCSSPQHKGYATYKNIEIDESWNDFMNFYNDMGDRPKGKTLDRVNNDLGYNKNNCRWATPEQQANNKKNNIFIEYKGLNLTLSQWSRKLGISRSTLANRYNNNLRGNDLFNKNKRYAQYKLVR